MDTIDRRTLTTDRGSNPSRRKASQTRRLHEVLNAEWFSTTKQAQTEINHWLKQYNHIRPHQALNLKPTVPETLAENSHISGPDIGG